MMTWIRNAIAFVAKAICVLILGVMLFTWYERATEGDHAAFLLVDALITTALVAPFYLIARLVEVRGGE